MNGGSDWLSSRALAMRRDCEADPPMVLSEGLETNTSANLNHTAARPSLDRWRVFVIDSTQLQSFKAL